MSSTQGRGAGWGGGELIIECTSLFQVDGPIAGAL